MLYRLPSEFCAYFTPFLGINRRWLSRLAGCGSEWLTILQQCGLSHRHSPSHGLFRNFCEIQQTRQSVVACTVRYCCFILYCANIG